MLFSMQKLDVFPVDVWIERVMTEIYLKDKKKDVDIGEFANSKFKEYAGVAQQYLFYWRRESKI